MLKSRLYNSTNMVHSLLLLCLNLLLSTSDLLVVLVEAAGGHLVQAEDGLVGVLDQHVPAVVALQAHVGDGAHDAPAVGQRQVHLVGEVARLPAHDAQDDVLVVLLGVGAGDEAVKIQLVKSAGKKVKGIRIRTQAS